MYYLKDYDKPYNFSQRVTLGAARNCVEAGNPLEARAMLLNYCDWCFGMQPNPRCNVCKIDSYLSQIRELCDTMRIERA